MGGGWEASRTAPWRGSGIPPVGWQVGLGPAVGTDGKCVRSWWAHPPKLLSSQAATPLGRDRVTGRETGPKKLWVLRELEKVRMRGWTKNEITWKTTDSSGASCKAIGFPLRMPGGTHPLTGRAPATQATVASHQHALLLLGIWCAWHSVVYVMHWAICFLPASSTALQNILFSCFFI